MKVTVDNPFPAHRKPVAQMEVGQLGQTDDGRIYLAELYGATCLNDLGRSYFHKSDSRDVVTLFPKGTAVTLEVG